MPGCGSKVPPFFPRNATKTAESPWLQKKSMRRRRARECVNRLRPTRRRERKRPRAKRRTPVTSWLELGIVTRLTLVHARLREGKTPPDTTASALPSVAPQTTMSKDYKEARLQIRLPQGGQPLVTSQPSEQSLQTVADWVTSQTGLSDVRFSVPFPRSVSGSASISSVAYI
jgi:hypothetical protein